MARHIELNPVSHFTVGTVGEPGKRVFFVQGSRGSELISLIIEKQQAQMLANSLEPLLDELQEKFPVMQRDQGDSVWMDLRLKEPVDPLFRVGNMGLGFNEEVNRIVVVAYELVDEGEEPNIVSFWATRAQIKSLIPHVLEVVGAGRPLCGNCGQPIDANGHFCPRRNGYKK
jgi:uncharacterized repeat protein (TIGR03847 family)